MRPRHAHRGSLTGLRHLVGMLLATLALAVFASHGAAQTSDVPDYDAWSSLAERAEVAVDANRASTVAFEDLRTQLVTARDAFIAAQSINAARISTLQDQIGALGPVPESPEVEEPPEISSLRAELRVDLAEAQAPSLRAQEAARRATGLIGEIDTIIRDRQAAELFALGPSLLMPQVWADTVLALQGTVSAVVAETVGLWINSTSGAFYDANSLTTLLYLVVAFVVVLRGRRWVEGLTRFVAERFRFKNVQGIVTFVVSLGQIALPYFGVLVMLRALTATDLLGLRGSTLLDLVPNIALIALGARWLGAQVFAEHAPLLTLTPLRRREGRLYATVLGFVVGLFYASRQLVGLENYTPGVEAVLRGCFVGIGALMIARIASMMLSHVRAEKIPVTEGEGADLPSPEKTFRIRLLSLLARAMLGIAVLAPLAAVVGYGRLAAGLVFPTVQTLAVLAVLAVLHRLVRHIYGAARGRSGDEISTSLLPVLVDFLFWTLSAPILALIWGARVSDLTELWTQFLSGVTIGGTIISPSNFLTFAVVFAALYTLTRMVQGAMRTTVLPKTKIDPGGQVALISGLGYIGVFLSAVVAITAAGIDLSNLALVAGALSIGIGFGLQTIVSNFVAGIILLVERPISEGDWIEVNGNMGFVRNISVRSTRIETFDRTDVIVPNADLVSGAVTNWTRGNLTGRVIVPVGVAYGTDSRKVEAILRELAEAQPMVILNPPPSILFQGFGADSLDFEIRAILRDVNYILVVKSELNHAIAERFAAEGIEIPFAQRDVWLRNPEVLRPGAGAQAVAADAEPTDNPTPKES